MLVLVLTDLTWVSLSTGCEYIVDSLLPVAILLCLVLAPVYIPAYLVWKQLCSVVTTSLIVLLQVANSKLLMTVISQPCRRVATLVASSYCHVASRTADVYSRVATWVASSYCHVASWTADVYTRVATRVASVYSHVASWTADVYHCTWATMLQ